jgi:hypothetical protein
MCDIKKKEKDKKKYTKVCMACGFLRRRKKHTKKKRERLILFLFIVIPRRSCHAHILPLPKTPVKERKKDVHTYKIKTYN